MAVVPTSCTRVPVPTCRVLLSTSARIVPTCRVLLSTSACIVPHRTSGPRRRCSISCPQVEFNWDGGSGFGRIRWRVGFGRIRADSEQPRRGFFCGIVQYVWAFRPCRNGLRIRTESVESRIRMDSDGFQDLKYGSRHHRNSTIVSRADWQGVTWQGTCVFSYRTSPGEPSRRVIGTSTRPRSEHD